MSRETHRHTTNHHVKEAARQARRVMERRALDAIRTGRVEAEDARFPVRNHEVADRWDWD